MKKRCFSDLEGFLNIRSFPAFQNSSISNCLLSQSSPPTSTSTTLDGARQQDKDTMKRISSAPYSYTKYILQVSRQILAAPPHTDDVLLYYR